MSGGGSAGKSTTTTTNNPDPTAQRLNTFAAEEAEAARAATGGTSAFLKTNPLALPSTEERATLGKIAGFADRPLLNPYEVEGLDAWRSASDPTLRLGAAGSMLQDITTPALTNSAIAGGFGGRSGAVLESIGRAGKEMALPIAQDVANKQAGMGTTLLSMGPQLESRELERLFTSLGGQEAPRLAELQESLRPQNLYYSQLLGVPTAFGSSQTSNTKGTAPETNWLTQVAVPLASAALMSYGGCWIAEAVYGRFAVETGYARHYLTFGAPAWFRSAYVKLAMQLPTLTARHRLIARVAMERGKLALGVE